MASLAAGGRLAHKARCNFVLGNVECGRAALIVIDRGAFGPLRICTVHMDVPAIYADVVRHGWKWDLLRTTDDLPEKA